MSESSTVLGSSSTTPRMGRRSMALSDIDPKYVSQSGMYEASEVETSRGSIRIQHLTSVSGPRPLCSNSNSGSATGLQLHPPNSPRFPKLEECAHFHYDTVDLPTLKLSIRDDSKSIGEDTGDKCAFSIEVVVNSNSSGSSASASTNTSGVQQSWIIRRSHLNLLNLDQQLQNCVWDRSFSKLEKVEASSTSEEHHKDCRSWVERYLARLSVLPTSVITCGTVLCFFELDNRGRRIIASDDSAINTPAVAACCAIKKYIAQASDEISFEVGDMISVIDLPAPNESIWWRGKRGFHVGFFPREHVQVIGEKIMPSECISGLAIVPSSATSTPNRRLQRLSVSSSNSSNSKSVEKPVLRKHGKLIAFFRSFILSRPSRRRLKQSGILRERVFSCDLAEHLLNTGNEIPTVLKCCAEFIETFGICDGIYRLSGVSSNIQRLRISFDEDKIPNLELDEAIKSDIHAVSSLLKMYFRELPNPLCTHQLYEKFVSAVQSEQAERIFRMREVVQMLPPPHYRTLEYLAKHLAKVASNSEFTGMTARNMAIVWAPNLLRNINIGLEALKGIGVQAVVTEYLIRHADLIFNDKLPKMPTTASSSQLVTTKRSLSSGDNDSGRPKSIAVSSPVRLMSLEEAQGKSRDDRKYFEVGGGPEALPPKYHTVIELPKRRSAVKNKRSSSTANGWKNFFSRNRSFSKPPRKPTLPSDITVITMNMPSQLQGHTNWAGRLRPVKSVESLVSPTFKAMNNMEDHEEQEEESNILSKSSPSTPMANVHVLFHPEPQQLNSYELDNSITNNNKESLQNQKTHNRSISHDSYFEFGEFHPKNNVHLYIDETLEEESDDNSRSSKLSLDNMSSGIESNNTSPRKTISTTNSKDLFSFEKVDRAKIVKSSSEKEMTSPSTTTSSTFDSKKVHNSSMSTSTSVISNFSMNVDDLFVVSENEDVRKSSAKPKSKPIAKERKSCSSTTTVTTPRKMSKDSQVQTSSLKLFDVGVSTYDDECNISESYSVLKSRGSGCGFSDAFTTSTSVPFVPAPDNIKYELDHNEQSSESSIESSPEAENEPFSMTNIIYSPLVNEQQLESNKNTIHSSKSKKQEQDGNEDINFKKNTHSSDENESINKKDQKVGGEENQPGTFNLFICPLYEAGIDFKSEKEESGQREVSTSPSKDQEVKKAEDLKKEDVKKSLPEIETKNEPTYQNEPAVVTVKKAHQYENIGAICNSAIFKTSLGTVVVEEAGQNSTSTSSNNNNQTTLPESTDSKPQNLYENERIYQNEVLGSADAQNQNQKINEDDEVKYTPILYENETFKDQIKIKQEQEQMSEDLYGGEHYENVDDEDHDHIIKSSSTGGAVENNYEGNIYEDIDDESVKYGKNKYETINYEQTPKSKSHQGSANNCADADTDEALYESVRFQRQGSLLQTKTNHQYAEIQDVKVKNKSTVKDTATYANDDMFVELLQVGYPDITNNKVKSKNKSTAAEDSSPNSNSNTEDMTTYLDEKCNLMTTRNDSLDLEDCDVTQLSVDEAIMIIDEKIEDDGEIIRHIDASPIGIIMDNPLYGVQSLSLEDELNGNTIIAVVDSKIDSSSMNVRRQSVVKSPDKILSRVSRCSSVPLTGTSFDTSLVLVDKEVDQKYNKNSSINSFNDKDKENIIGSIECKKIALCKRFSEPNLQTSRSSGTSSLSSGSSGGGVVDDKAAWKLADAKKLANRKQSVRELLSKFEIKDGSVSPCPPNTCTSPSSLTNSFSISPIPGPPGLPRPVVIDARKPRNNVGSSGGSGGGRFQHHRFSMGDIKMTQSLSAYEDLKSIGGGGTPSKSMTRSDTFPELTKIDTSKENKITSANQIAASQPSSLVDSKDSDVMVPEKVQQAIRVAMCSVDMNDPCTRERIEKYKEERRNFLREKINSELITTTTNTNTQPSSGAAASISKQSQSASSDSRGSISSIKSRDGSSDSVFGNLKSNFLRSTSTHPSLESTTTNITNSKFDSPRKRAFSEDISSGYLSSQQQNNKSIKTDCVPMSISPTSTSPTKPNIIISPTNTNTSNRKISFTPESHLQSPDEVNVKEKVALWSTSSTTSTISSENKSQSKCPPKRANSSSCYLDSSSGTTTTSSSSVGVKAISTITPSSGAREDLIKSRPVMKESKSLPPEGFLISQSNRYGGGGAGDQENPKVINTSSNSGSNISSLKSGKKMIKDMAAFFEGKQF